MRTARRPVVTICLLAGCGDFDLPPRIGASEYIAYHTDVDASVICVDDLLAREDRFIERTAALLGVDPPGDVIDFVWDPVQDGAEPWACRGMSRVPACYMHRDGDDLSVVVSRTQSQRHELTHAVAIQRLGDAHPVLEEGLAEYLGSLNRSPASEGFPAAFRAMVDDGTETMMDYRLAMHFVGSIFARHGAEKYRALRARMPVSAGLERFAEVFAAEYGQSLDDALAEMSAAPVDGQAPFEGCGDGEARVLEWTGDGVLDVAIESGCGDPWFYGVGFADGLPGFVGRYVVEVAEAGDYWLTVGGVADGPAPVRVSLTSCAYAVVGGIGATPATPGTGPLQPGRYSLAIAFPARPEARGAATVRLEAFAPP